VAVDGNGNIFVTGTSVRTAEASSYVTIAYSGSGVALWTDWYTGPRNLSDRNSDALALALDASGNVFVTGYSYDGLIGTSPLCASVLAVSGVASRFSEEWFLLSGGGAKRWLG